MRIENLIGVSARTIPLLKRGIKNRLTALFEIETKELVQCSEDGENICPCFNLAICLDRSGSMRGAPLENSKAAIEYLISTLLGPRDLLHLVVYDSYSAVVFKNGTYADKEFLLSKVRGVYAGSNTNCLSVMSGVNSARDVLLSPISESHPGSKRIFLFSDGMVNAGIVDKTEIRESVASILEQGVHVSSFGLGSSFDEDLMTAISVAGSGSFYYIDGASNIVETMFVGMSVLKGLIARRAVLSVVGVNGACVTKIWGRGGDDGGEEAAMMNGIQIGDLSANDYRSALVDFEVAVPGKLGISTKSVTSEPEIEGDDEEEGETQDEEKEEEMFVVLTYELSFVPVGSDDAISKAGFIEIPLTDDLVVLEEPPELLVAKTIAMTGELDNKLTGLIDTRAFDRAITLKEKNVAELERVVDIDDKGVVKILLDRAKVALTDLKRRSIHVARKNLSYSGSWCRSPRHSSLIMSPRAPRVSMDFNPMNTPRSLSKKKTVDEDEE